MTLQPNQPADSIDAIAQDWIVRLNESHPNDALKAEFEDWVAADPGNRLAFERAQCLWEDVGFADSAAHAMERLALQDSANSTSPETSTSRRAWLAMGLAACLAAIATVTVTFLHTGVKPETYATKVGETQSIELADGSQLTLGPSTRLTANLNGRERRVSLLQGRVAFDVAHDADRLFTVTSGETRVEVLGTRFTLRQGQRAVGVSVQEGAVAVAPLGQSAASPRGLQLSAGQQVTADMDGTLGMIQPADHTRELAWLNGRLVYDGTPLIEVVHDLNTYRTEKIRISDPILEDLRITTSFRVDQADQMLDGLARSQPLFIRRSAGRVFLFADPG